MANSVFFLNLAWSWVVLVYIGRSWLILVEFCKSLLILLVFGWSYFILAYLSWTSLGNTGYSGNLVLHDPVGEKSERKKKKSGKHPTFDVPSPVQPPLQLMFDIFMFSSKNIRQINQLSLKDKWLPSLDIYSQPDT